MTQKLGFFNKQPAAGQTTFAGYAVLLCSDRQFGNDCLSPLLKRLGGYHIKENVLKLIGQLNLNLDCLLQNPERKQVGQLIELLALIDQCIDQTKLLILFEELDGQLPPTGTQLCH